ncbi:hypothetical protein AB0L66_34085 [Streptomyces sp. NPDC052207]|uniref:hypothetical protein n=1 Tax=Streptomyces sp. NPDC052207 TaxID=3155418 RepID=UPI00344872B0
MPSPRRSAGNGEAGSPRAGTDSGAPLNTWLAQLRRKPVHVRFERREALTAAGIYLAIAVTGFGLLMAISHFRGYHATDVLTRWDSARYLHIAEHGYPNHLEYAPDGLPEPSALAFFPMVPALIRVVHLVTFLPFPYAGVVVSWSMAAISAAGVHTLARSLFGRRAGYACVGLWACSPYAFALWVPYSEATFTAFLMWTLIAVMARRWLWAGVLCALAGTVRPTSAVLVAVVAISAIRALTLRRAGRRPWAAMGLAPLGLIFSWLYLGSRIGRLDGWFIAEKAWDQQFDFGLGSLRFLQKLITYQNADIRYPLVLTVILVVAVGVVALALDRQVPWPLVLALAGAWELMFGTPGAPLSKPRFILPFLPIMLLLVMRPVARLPRTVQGCLYGSGAIFAGWYAFGLLVLFKHPP